MESIDLELGELFDRDAVDEDDGDDVGANPDAVDGDVETADRQEGDEVLSNLNKLAKGAAKKRVMKPQPKLDAQRLMSDRGLACLPNLFKDVEFRGKGHETEDLAVLMSKLEHWAHRLFPKVTFDDFVERLEKLGAKKGIQTCLKRIRLDMPILDSDFATADGPDAQEENVMDAEAAYDAMVQDELANQQRQQASSESDGDNDDDDDDHLNSLSNMSSEASKSTQPSTEACRPSLNSELQQRIEQNRLMAMQKRAARLSLLASSQDSPSSHPSSASAVTSAFNCEASGSNSLQNSMTVTSSAEVMQTADEIINDLEANVA